ncbi:hypothetical protein B6D60_02240 [candidate division KSB1 bacterium 4484_87]|nr:MAG: hypothetical protein B6D60_02240 [candidate division KSB1 bacterium 4484_87]
MSGTVKKAIICPNCGKLISANAEECYYCGLKNPGKFGMHSFIQRIFGSKITIVNAIIYFSVALYVIALIVDPRAILRPSGGIFNLFSPSWKALVILGITGAPSMYGGQYWTLITAIYLHGGLLHILFNMLWVKQLGPMVEQIFGTSRFFLIFTISGVFGFVLSNALTGAPTIGASGSIFGLLGALIYYGRARGGTFGQYLYPQLLSWAVILFLFGFFMPGINNLAHLGGFIGGYVSGNILGYQEAKHESMTLRKIAAILIVLTIACFVISVMTVKSSMMLYFR